MASRERSQTGVGNERPGSWRLGLLERSELEDDFRGPRTNRSWQMQMYLNTCLPHAPAGIPGCRFITIKGKSESGG